MGDGEEKRGNLMTPCAKDIFLRAGLENGLRAMVNVAFYPEASTSPWRTGVCEGVDGVR